MERGVISAQTLADAQRNNARVNLAIGQPTTRPSGIGITGFDISSNGTARISTTASSPFSTQTVNSSTGSFELGDVTVTINDQPTLVRSVSPTELTVVVPANIAGGIASVGVTSREGFVHYGTASVAGLNPRVFGPANRPIGDGFAVDALSVLFGVSSVNLPVVIGLDGQRRISLMTTGLSTGLPNWDRGNDVFQGEVRGVDQVTVIVPPQLNGAGRVQVTIIAGGVRSNSLIIRFN
jgi:hypothetical protein